MHWWNGIQTLSKSSEEQRFENSSCNRALNKDAKASASSTQTALLEETPMKKLFACAAALGLFAAVPALSAPNDHNRGKHDTAPVTTQTRSDSGDTHRNTRTGTTAGAAHVRTGSAHVQEGTTTARRFNAGNNSNIGNNTMRRKGPAAVTPATTRSQVNTNSRHGNSGWSGNTTRHKPVVNTRHGNNGWSGNTTARHPSINSLRLNVQSSRRFHNGDYRVPAGYHSRHWGHGERLPRYYFVRDYWITNFLMFGLFAPPTDLIWVRVGDDALLVDRYSGDIVQVRYDVFY
jgi:Ni/Co efflux regulator RcnB